jgi:parallel beta-helix repeat protein
MYRICPQLLFVRGNGFQAFSQVDVTIVPYMSTGYKYSLYSPSAPFPASWQSSTFNDTRWSTGVAGFGTVTLPNTPPCPLNNPEFVGTSWPQSRNLLVRRTFSLPAGARNIRVSVAIDNAVQVFFNGVDISGGIRNHDVCAGAGDYVFVVPDNLLRVGNNVVAASGLWRSGQSYLDMQVVGDFVKTITATSGANGTIAPSGSILVNIGSSQSFDIMPDAGYHVLDVLVDGNSQGPLTSYTFTNVTDNHTISAIFAPNTVVVGNTNDSGPGSLRDAIEAANDDPAIDSIRFVFLTPGPHTINLNSPLPELLNDVVLDACTQQQLLGSPIPIVEINGNGAAGDGLVLSAGNTTVCGLVINRFQGSGIVIQSDSNVIIGNLIGTDPTGGIDLGNGLDGVRVVSGDGNRIGGAAAHERNVISGNERNGISLESAGPTTVQNNHIGTDAAGETPLANAWSGIQVTGGANHEIGGTAGSGNLISGNGSNGIELESTTGVIVNGNRIGTNATGAGAAGNSGNGVLITGTSSGNTVGGGNVISGNGGAGIAIFDASGNSVKGNRIGTNASGNSPLGNQSDGVIIGSVSLVPIMNTIGGLGEGEGNTIAHNGGAGVVIMSGTQHAMLGNSIFGNAALGIDLAGDGVTPNHTTGPGPNNCQKYPVLNFAAFDLRSISGSLVAEPLSTYRVEFFSSNAVDASGYGEGERFVGAVNVTTDTAGLGTFYISVPGALSATEFVTSTATDASNNTSEFSAAIATVSKVKLFGEHYVVNTTLSGIPLHWSEGIGVFRISHNVPAEFHAPIVQGYMSWGALPPLTYIYGGVTDTTTWGGDPDRINNTVWVTDGWEELTGIDPSAIAVTRVRYNALNGQITDADIAFDAQHFFWDATGGNPESMDVENVTAHEAGHFSGLGDIYNPGDPGYAPSMGAGTILSPCMG